MMYLQYFKYKFTQTGRYNEAFVIAIQSMKSHSDAEIMLERSLERGELRSKELISDYVQLLLASSHDLNL